MSRGLTDLSPSARRASGRGFHRSSPQSSTRFPSLCSARPSGRSSPQSSTRFPSRCLARPSGRSLKTILKPVQGAVLWAGFDRAVSSVIPSIFHPVSLTLLSSVLWPVPQNNSQAGPRGGLRHGHPAHKYLSAIPACRSSHLSSLRHGHPVYRYSSGIPACRTIQQSLSNRHLNGPRPVLATATLPTGTSGAFPRGKAVIYHPFATAILPTGTPVASRRAEQSHNLSQTGLKLALDRSSPRPPYPQVPQSHPGVAKPSSIIPSPRPPYPQVVLCHPHVPNNPTISLKPASNRTSTGPLPRPPCPQAPQCHPDVANNPTISLKPASNWTSTGPSPRPPCPQVPQGHSRRGKAVIYHPFATDTRPTGTPVASPRAETSQNRSLKDVPSGS